jgi:hypothetical protein
MTAVLVPLLRRSCPEGASGFGGYFQVNLGDEEAVGLGGVELIRAAMRGAARRLGWKTVTVGWIGTRNGTMVVVRDEREIPDAYRAVVDEAMNVKLRSALHKVWGQPGPGPVPVQRGSVALMTQEFRAAVAQADSA